MLHRKLFMPAIMFLVMICGCTKEDIPKFTASGELIDGGSIALDGVGFYLRLDDKQELSPDNLPDSLKITNIRARVAVTYTNTGEVHRTMCGSCPGLPVVHLVSIARQ